MFCNRLSMELNPPKMAFEIHHATTIGKLNKRDPESVADRGFFFELKSLRKSQ